MRRAAPVFDAISSFGQRRPLLITFAAVAVVYSVALTTPFQFDDYAAIVGRLPARDLGAWWADLGHGLRPALKFTFAATAAAGGGVVSDHLVSLAIHLLNVALVFACARAASVRAAWLAALLFALHPLQTEAVTYLSGRSSALAATWCLAALLFHIHGVRRGRPAFTFGLAPAAFVMAALTKETAIALPLAVLAWDLLIERAPPRRVLARQALWWSLLIGLFVAAVMHPRGFALLHDAASRGAPGAKAYLQSVGYLVSRIVRVERLSIDPGLDFMPVSAPLVALGVASLALALTAAVREARRCPTIAFGALWFALNLAVPYAFVARWDGMNERHFYLPSAGLFLVIGALWDRHLSGSRRARALAAAAVIVLAVATFARNRDYQSEIALWEQTRAASPHNPRAHHNLGFAYESAGRVDEARAAYSQALALEPRFEAPRRALARLDAAAAGAERAE